MITFILFLILLSIIVVVHEFGHLIAAKFFKVYCSEFAIGMGPKLFSIKGKETEYSFRLLPLGGFVAMAGDVDNALETKTNKEIPLERTLLGIKKYQKIIIMLAGIVMNIILAIMIVAGVLLYNGYYQPSPDTIIDTITENSPASQAGIMVGDKIIELRYDDLGISTKPKTFNDIGAFTFTHEKEVLTIKVERDQTILEYTLKASFDSETNSYKIGIGTKANEPLKVTLLNAIPLALDYISYVFRTILMSLSQLIKGIGLENLSGPVGIYEATDEAVSAGGQTYLLMIAVLSLNVGIFNALPLPILDGGRVVLLLVEAIIRKPLSNKANNILMGISMILLMILLVFATYQDIFRLFS